MERVALYAALGYLALYGVLIKFGGPDIDPTLPSIVGAVAGLAIGTFIEEEVMRRNRRK